MPKGTARPGPKGLDYLNDQMLSDAIGMRSGLGGALGSTTSPGFGEAAVGRTARFANDFTPPPVVAPVAAQKPMPTPTKQPGPKDPRPDREANRRAFPADPAPPPVLTRGPNPGDIVPSDVREEFDVPLSPGDTGRGPVDDSPIDPNPNQGDPSDDTRFDPDVRPDFDPSVVFPDQLDPDVNPGGGPPEGDTVLDPDVRPDFNFPDVVPLDPRIDPGTINPGTINPGMVPGDDDRPLFPDDQPFLPDNLNPAYFDFPEEVPPEAAAGTGSDAGTGSKFEPFDPNEWRTWMDDAEARWEAGREGIFDQSYADEARAMRSAANATARLGSGASGALGAAAAQTQLGGMQQRQQALQEYQKQGLELKMAGLDRAFKQAQLAGDRNAQMRIQDEMNRAAMDMTYIDAMLGADVATLQYLDEGRASGTGGGGGTGAPSATSGVPGPAVRLPAWVERYRDMDTGEDQYTQPDNYWPDEPEGYLPEWP